MGMFSTKGIYALRAMADLAGHEGRVSLGDVSKRQNISRKYLEQVISLMHKAGYVQSQRGKGGGYKLTREPKDYTLGEILRAAEGSLAPVNCLNCSNGTICPQVELPRLEDLGRPRAPRGRLLLGDLQRQVTRRRRAATSTTPPASRSAAHMSPTAACSG